MHTERDLFFRYLAQTSPCPAALEIDKAEGMYLYDKHGKRYMDLISGISVSNTGHRHAHVLKAVREQLDKYLHLMVFGEYIQTPQVKLAEKLAGLLPDTLDSVYFVNSGSEAVEGALKLAKRYTGRSQIIAFKNAYHGSSHGSLSVMGNEGFKQDFRPLLPGITFLEFNNTNDLHSITEETSCVIVEPVQGEAGIVPPENDFLPKLKKKCSETGTLLILDEIQTGMGRTGKFFAFGKYDIVPDILLLAKGLGGGMPLGAFISSREIMSSLTVNPSLGHITTFGGHPLCCAAALANIEVIINEKLVDDVLKKEQLFRELLIHPMIRQVRSSGLMMALELNSHQTVMDLIKLCMERGVILDWFLFNDCSVRIAPPLIISFEEIKQACSIIRDSMDKIVES